MLAHCHGLASKIEVRKQGIAALLREKDAQRQREAAEVKEILKAKEAMDRNDALRREEKEREMLRDWVYGMARRLASNRTQSRAAQALLEEHNSETLEPESTTAQTNVNP